MAVSHRSNRLKIDGRSIELEKNIRDVVEYPDRVVVLFGNEEYNSEKPFADRNIIAVGRDGKLLWRIADSNELFPDIDPFVMPFVGFEKMKIDGREALVAYEMIGMCYEVDLETGFLSNPKVSR